MKLTLVIPAHNEEDVIEHTIRGIEELLRADYGIIVVNDNSTDGTACVVKRLMAQFGNLRLVDNTGERGFAGALKKGFSVADSEFIVPVMADLCDDPETIEQMIEKALEGVDIVCGSRYMYGGKKSGGPYLQSFFSKFVGVTLKYLIGIPTCDISNSFKCYRKIVLEQMQIESKAFEISMEITLKAYFKGFKITEVPTCWQGRSIGKSKFYLFKVAPEYFKLYFWAIFKKIFS